MAMAPAFLGATAAAAVGVAWKGAAPAVLVAVGLAVIGAVGLPDAGRRAAVRSANSLLGTDLPAPAAPRPLATAVWLLAWTGAGTALAAASAMTLTALALPVIWINGGDTVTIAVTFTVPAGSAGWWTVPVAAGSLAALGLLSAAYAALMRPVARRLLGHGLAERLAAAEAEADRTAARNRLARELHDSIGHTLTTSTIQAAVARQVLESDPASARLALASIEDASRTALDELDRALGVLREEPAPVTAAPTLAALGSLGERVRRTGTGFDLEVDGDLDAVPPVVSREAYRIVQEGVTNALKHAAGEAVAVRFRVTGARLELRVANRVESRQGGVGGRHGLTGIAERVRLLGGDLSAGPDGQGRWAVRAALPLRGPDRTTPSGNTRPST